ncbi:hypothetical protein D3C71_351300 [compost metagenome]
MPAGLQNLDSRYQQISLTTVFGFKACLPGMNRDKARCPGAILVMTSAQRQNEPMGIRFGAAIHVMHGHIEIANAVQPARHAPNRAAQGVVEPLLSG